MASTTLTSMPSAIYAGDSFDLLYTASDYPASSGWTLVFSFRAKEGSVIEITSSASGSDHLFNVVAATTGGWIPGTYKGVGRVNNGTKYVTVWGGSLTVLPDMTQQSDNYDTRTNAKICLDAIDAVMLGKATRDVMHTTIAGQSIGRMSWAELLSAKSFYQDRVDSEVAAENAKNNLGNSRNVLIRFNRP